MHLSKSRIINFTRNKSRRVTFDQTVDAGKGLKQQRRVVLDTVKALPFVLETPAPNVWIEAADQDKAVLRVSIWVNQRESDVSLARGEAIRIVRDSLLEAAKKPAENANRKHKKERVENVGTEENAELERMIESERGETEAGDLLNRDAMEE